MQFSIPELLVKGCVMCEQRMVASKIRSLFHDLCNAGRFAHHRVADAGQNLDVIWDGHARVHEALEAILYALLVDQYHGDLGRTRALYR